MQKMKRRNFIKTLAAGITGLSSGSAVAKDVISDVFATDVNRANAESITINQEISVGGATDSELKEQMKVAATNGTNDYLNVGDGYFFHDNGMTGISGGKKVFDCDNNNETFWLTGNIKVSD